MSVYLSEIKMPKGEGSKLVLQIFPNGEVYDGHGIRLGIANWAEAMLVPPHGRLIDADTLYEVVKNRTRNWAGGWSDIKCVLTGNDIKNAPTIIPAEPEEEGNHG